MSVKAEVSTDYIRALKEKHGAKPYQKKPNALMSGVGKAGSIGAAIANRIRSSGGMTWEYPLDVRVPVPQLGAPYNALIMSHGVTHQNWFEFAPMDKVKEVIDVNLFGSYNLAAAFVRGTIDHNWRKRIIMIGSMAHRVVLNGSSSYCASKAGLAMLGKALAWELAPKGYDVFVIHPSNVDGTPMAEDTIAGLMRYRDLTREQAVSYWGDNYIRGSSLSTGEISDLVMYLLTTDSGYLSGSQFELTGGQR